MNIGTLTVTLGVNSQLSAGVAAMRDFTSKTTASLNTISQRFRTFGYLATATITYPMVMAGKASINAAKDFEFSMQKIVGLAGVAQESVTAWNDELLKMSTEVAKKPQELAEALYYITSSGIKGAESLNVLQISARAATAGLGETQEVANLLTSALNAYAGEGLTAAKAADILVAAVREGKGEADAFARTMGQIIPIAANVGVSFDQVAGAMAAITLTGSTAANAAVYLKGVFNSLLTAADQGKLALKGMDLTYADLRKILSTGPEGLINLMQKFRDVQMKLGDEAVKDVLPNIRGLTAFMSIAGENFKYNTELMKRVTDSAGSLASAFAAVSNTIKIKMDRAMAGVNVSLITLGKSLAVEIIPIIEWLSKKLSELTIWFDSLSEAEKRNKIVKLAIIAVLGPLSLMIATVGYILSGLVSTIRLVTLALDGLWAAFAVNPVMALLAGISLLILGIIRLAKSTKKTTDEWAGLNKMLDRGNVYNKLAKDLEQQTVNIEKLNKRQLTDTENNIRQIIALEEDKNLQLKTIWKDGIRADQWMWEQRKKIQELEKDLIKPTEKQNFWETRTFNGRHGNLYFNWVHKVNEIQKELMNAQNKMSQHELTVIERLKTEIENSTGLLEYYKNQLSDIEVELNKVAKAEEKAAEQLNNYNAFVEEFGKYTDELESINVLEKGLNGLGIAYDSAEDKMEVYRKQLEFLIQEGYPKESKEIQDVITKYDELSLKLKELSAINRMFIERYAGRIESGKGLGGGFDLTTNKTPQQFGNTDMQKFFMKTANWTAGAFAGFGNQEEYDKFREFSKQIQNDLDTITRKEELLGSSYDSTRAKVQLYSTAYNHLIENFTSGNPIIDAAINNFKLLADSLQNSLNIEGINDMLQSGLTELLKTFSEGIGQLAAGLDDVNLGEGLLGRLSILLIQLGAYMISLSPIVKAIKIGLATLSGPLLLLGGVALVAIGSGMAAAITRRNMETAESIPGHKEGNFQVPPGYPNDSYLTRLSSGETVFTPAQLRQLVNQQGLSGQVVFKVAGRDLVGVFENYDKFIKNY